MFAQLAMLAALAAGCQPTTTPATAQVDPSSNALSAPPASETDKCNTPNQYDLPAGRLDEMAQQLAHGTGCFIEVDLAAFGAVPVAAVHGRMTLRQALATALRGTKLEVTAAQAGQLNVGLRK